MHKNKESIQEFQYKFPYHHITEERNGAIFIFQHLFWGLVHYTYISVVIDKLIALKPNSVADVGCGEGRIICELEKRNLPTTFYGYDISERAIAFAKAFSNGSSHFAVHDILEQPLEQKVDMVISCEVVEHIKPEMVKTYISHLHKSVNQNGVILLTTPTTNVPVNAKHYQHFTSNAFDDLLAGKFEVLEYTYLNRVNLLSKILERLIANRFFLSNSKLLNRFVLTQYKKRLLFGDYSNASRILVIAKKI